LFSLNSYQLQIIYDFRDWPVRALSCVLSCFCLGSAWAPWHGFLLQGRMGTAFIERRLSLLFLFIIFLKYIDHTNTKYQMNELKIIWVRHCLFKRKVCVCVCLCVCMVDNMVH
jgi:hypothetical protein